MPRLRLLLLGFQLFALTLVLTLFTRGAAAANFAPGCTAGVGDSVALVTAIATANANGEADTITLGAGCTYSFALANNTTIGSTALPVIVSDTNHSLTIVGAGATITRTGVLPFRILVVNGGNLIASDLTISNGLSDSAFSFTDGGNIRVQSGALSLNKVTIASGTASLTTSGYGGGVAVKSGSTTTITNSSIENNKAVLGGGLYCEGGTLTVSNSTVSGNSSTTDGGGIDESAGTVTLTNVTVVRNTCAASGGPTGNGGGIAQAGGTFTLVNTLVAANTDKSDVGSIFNSDVFGTFVDSGNNFLGSSDGSTSFTVSTLHGTEAAKLDSQVGVLADNGGSTKTAALPATSAAINAGNNAICTNAPVSGLDQRGFSRAATVCDIGAFELQNTLTLTLASSQNPSVFGQSVTLTGHATIAGPAGATLPTTNFTITEGQTVVGQGVLNGSGDFAFTTTTLTVGSHVLTFNFGGNASFAAASSPTLTQVVTVDASTTVLASSSNPAVISQEITFTATVAVTAPGTAAPTGTVTFKDGTTVLGTVNVTAGVATFKTSTLSDGSHTITAEYSGDANVAPSTSTAVVQIVAKDGIMGNLVSSKNPSTVGDSVTFTVTYTATTLAVAPTGSIEFRDGTTVLGTGALASGVATFTTSALTVGQHAISAVFAGDANYTPVTSTLTQTVNALPIADAGTDSGPSQTDAGPTTHDAGPSTSDSGTHTDAGSNNGNAGNTGLDGDLQGGGVSCSAGPISSGSASSLALVAIVLGGLARRRARRHSA